MAKAGKDGSPRNHRTQRSIIENEPRCIYCASTSQDARITLEHMPPIGMFRQRQRLKGMEYATCQDCNNGTRGADLVASFFARIAIDDDMTSWRARELMGLRRMMDMRVPGVLDEVFDSRKSRNMLLERPSGLLVEKVQVRADGPLVKAYLDVFSAKMAMAIFREHVGEALPLHGRIETIWFLNGGLADVTAHTMLSILPTHTTLVAGQRNVAEQFAYRFNTDGTEIVAALVGFHSNLHVFVMASSNPIYEGIQSPPGTHKCRPGQLLAMMPKVQRFVLPGLPGSLAPG